MSDEQIADVLECRRAWGRRLMTLERITEELRRVAITTSYLFVCFSAVLFYRMAVLQKYGIDLVSPRSEPW